MIRFEMLGEISLKGADGTVVDAVLRQPKRLALLAYLASPAPGSWHRRDVVISHFWPELDGTRARSSLRNALYVLRQSLGEECIRGRGDEELSLDPARITTDLAALHEAVREQRGGDALELCRGDLLPGLYPTESAGFQQWLELERSRLRKEVARVGLAWSDRLMEAGRKAEALGAVQQVLVLRPDDETAIRRLMSIHQSMGDRAGAIAAYESWRGWLASEFDAVPAPETAALAQRLRGTGEPLPSLPATTEYAPPSAAPQGRTSRRRPLAMVTAIVLLAVAALAFARGGRPTGVPALGDSRPLTYEDGLQIQPSIAPNGRVVAYVKGTPSRMRIWIQRINGGAPWTLTNDSATSELLPRWSPDGDQVVYLSRNGAWLAPMVGGTPRLLIEGGEGDAMVRSVSWSPNGDSIVVVRNDSVTVRPVEGVGARFVGHGEQVHSCVWASNRPWIACVSGNWVAHTPGPLFGNRAPSAIVLFPAAGGPARSLTDREKEYSSPAWTTDGRDLWVASDRDGIPGAVYAIAVDGAGRPDGDYRRIGITAEAVAISEGAVAWSVPIRRANIWTLPIPSDGPVGLDSVRALTTGNQVIEVPDVSADGEWIVFDSNLRGNSDIYRMAVSGGSPERITDDPREEFAASLAPDGEDIAFHLWSGGERRVMVKRLQDATVREVMTIPGDWGVPRWSPDSRGLVAWHHAREEGAITRVSKDSTGAWRAPDWTLSGAQLPVWSPDGRTIAFVQLSGSIGLIPADSGSVRVVYTPRTGTNDPIATFLLWKDSLDRLLFLGHVPSGGSGVWELSLLSGRITNLVDFGDRTTGPAITSNGRNLYFTLDERLSNIRWASLERR